LTQAVEYHRNLIAVVRIPLRHAVHGFGNAASERITSDTIVERLLETVPLPKSPPD